MLCLIRRLAALLLTTTVAIPPITAVAGSPTSAVAGSAAEACASCHQLQPDAKPRWGPSLLGIFDGRIGAQEDYRYGSYLRSQREAGGVWTEGALRAWLTDSKAVAKAAGGRTKMPPQRLSDAQIDEVLLVLRSLR